MKLVNLKLSKEYEYGDVLLGGYVPPEYGEEDEDKVLLLSAITEIRDQVRMTSL